MTDKERALSKAQIGALYVRMKGVPLDKCFYCGEPRQSLDHCPPLSVASNMKISDLRKRKIPLLLVPCCLECNHLLGAKKLGTPLERANYLYGALQAKISKEYHGWTREELEELGYNLREMVEHKLNQVEVWIKKLRGVERTILMYDADRDVSDC